MKNFATHEIIGELRAAWKYLDKANHDYKGHRAKAEQEVNLAIQELEKYYHAHHKVYLKVTVPYPHPKYHSRLKDITESQQRSNIQVKIAEDILVGLQGSIVVLPKTKDTTAAARHVKEAIAQIQLALKDAPITTPK